MQNNMISKLENGMVIKGSYQAIQNGMIFDVQVFDNLARPLASVKFTAYERPSDPAQTLQGYISQVRVSLEKYRVNQMQTYRILKGVVPTVLRKEFTKAA